MRSTGFVCAPSTSQHSMQGMGGERFGPSWSSAAGSWCFSSWRVSAGAGDARRGPQVSTPGWRPRVGSLTRAGRPRSHGRRRATRWPRGHTRRSRSNCTGRCRSPGVAARAFRRTCRLFSERFAPGRKPSVRRWPTSSAIPWPLSPRAITRTVRPFSRNPSGAPPLSGEEGPWRGPTRTAGPMGTEACPGHGRGVSPEASARPDERPPPCLFALGCEPRPSIPNSFAR
ncbi:uncharacterized protein STAUR_1878 [Stigmatella aurantiaca DW4/3-1]|uniref:Uncharacterized protein n=1 Tax=Stigmatella aurantiaca (strain DW4/3-1) TaxID=378806 RepID=E3FV44_STIAD|nr:uncharacterized protein STAUR_1878 [Stigmatella aurantiaca DW4/3-1]